MLTKVAINRQNFNYQAFADLLENYENEFAKGRVQQLIIVAICP